MNSLLVCSLLCFSHILLFILPSFAHNAITLTLSKPHPSTLKHEKLISHLTKSTLQRAYHLKYGKKNPSFSSALPLYPISIGGYSIMLSLGTPPQEIPAVFDTGSSLVWVPCTSQYSCTNCTTTNNNTNIITFKPKLSTSRTHIGCHSERCKWLDQPGSTSSCFSCNRTTPSSCNSPCNYGEEYGSGATVGQATSDNLNLSNNTTVHDFFFGCSSATFQIPEGIVGFGRTPVSLPNQLKLNKFSYCLVSHKFDDTSRGSNLILGNISTVPGTKYTPLLKNPPMIPFNIYYYVQLEAITVNRKLVRIPWRFLVPGSNGNGGSIVDSGSTMTSMITAMFNPLMKEFMAQLSLAQRKKVEVQPALVGNGLCVNVSGDRKESFPDVVFHFRGGVTIDLTEASYVDNGDGVLCLPFVDAGSDNSGPAVIIGNYQQQNYHVEYDLRNERLGLKKQRC